MLMRQVILREIGKAIEEQTKETHDQTSIGLENSKATEEDDSTSVMIGKVDIAETPILEGIMLNGIGQLMTLWILVHC